MSLAPKSKKIPELIILEFVSANNTIILASNNINDTDDIIFNNYFDPLTLFIYLIALYILTVLLQYSERPRTERSVWQTGRKSVRLLNVRISKVRFSSVVSLDCFRYKGDHKNYFLLYKMT